MGQQPFKNKLKKMRIKLKLSNHTKKDGYKLVELYYFNQGKPVVLDTDVHVLEKFFDEAAVMKISSKVQTHKEDNDKLAEKEKRLKKIISDWQKRMIEDFGEEYGELYPPSDYVKQTWKKPEKDFANEEDVKVVFHKWIEGDQKSGLVGKKSKVKEVSIYRTVLGDIKKLYKKRPLTFRDINQTFFQTLLTYWTTKKPRIENSTINKRLTCLKIFLREEPKNKYTFFESFRSGLSGVSNQPVIIPNDAEFKQLVNAEVALKVKQLPKELDCARDYFVIGCSTSLRYSDIVRLTPANIMMVEGHECLVTFIQKTQTLEHVIPLNSISKCFLEKQFKSNNNKGMKYMSNWKLNEQLHILFQQLGFNSIQQVIYKYGSKATPVPTPKWKAMSMHASRAYFISRCVNSNKVSLGSTMNWSNHHNIKVVQRYIHKGFQQVQQMQQLFANVILPQNNSAVRNTKLIQISNIANRNKKAK
jgi:integrase